ncbi:bifunctional uridylyltransferase/uridylyl-removing protein GlnD [Sesbania bispinosa]|nr:bifunctional uridylyltransferase/uridylyl-removing protein GlnD [Sesbania bispinosa]
MQLSQIVTAKALEFLSLHGMDAREGLNDFVSSLRDVVSMTWLVKVELICSVRTRRGSSKDSAELIVQQFDDREVPGDAGGRCNVGKGEGGDGVGAVVHEVAAEGHVRRFRFQVNN